MMRKEKAPKVKKKRKWPLIIILTILPIGLAAGAYFAAQRGLIPNPLAAKTPPAKPAAPAPAAEEPAASAESESPAAADRPRPAAQRPNRPSPRRPAAPSVPTTDPDKGARTLAKVWERMEPKKLADMAAGMTDERLVPVLVKMDARRAAALLSELDAQRAATLSMKMQDESSKIPPKTDS